MEARYSNPDNDPEGAWTSGDLSARNYYSEGTYSIECPGGRVIGGPPPGTYWRIKKSKFLELAAKGEIWWGEDGNNQPRLKRYLKRVKQGRTPQTLWFYDEVGHTQDAKKTLIEMDLLKDDSTITPKPVALLERVMELASEPDSMILDSFAGSGTTAHAVLKANAKDGGSRKFILVESEDYADRLTAERVRRAIKGYAWSGTQRETLLEEKITWTQFRKADEWLKKIEAIKVKEGFAEGDLADQGRNAKKRFDKINVEVKDGVLRVEGEKRVSERAEGLGGEFTYCTLGEPLDIEKLLSGESLPHYDALGAWLFHTATGGTLLPRAKDAPAWYLGEAKDAHVWLIYEPRLEFLKSPEASLTLGRANEFSVWAKAHGDPVVGVKRSLVFAPAKYVSNKQLAQHGIDYAPLPFALFRSGR